MALRPCLFYLSFAFAVAFADFYTDVETVYGADHMKILDNGQELQLRMDKTVGSGFQSKKEYLYGKLDMRMKLVPNESAGTVTSFYLSSKGSKHDELDFEFLGNLSGDPYIMQTNVFSQGVGNREVKFFLWFDPTKAFHKYTLLWNPNRIVFYVDGVPVRVFKNQEHLGVPYPKGQAMRMYATLWDGSYWATRGGKTKIDWSKAPFVASYRNYKAHACNPGKACNRKSWWMREALTRREKKLLRWARKNYMIYDYCTDIKRFPHDLPRECIDNAP